VGGMIVYKNDKPSFNDYRKFLLDRNLKDDYHRFSEMIYRRYYSLLINKQPLPDLIIADGGKLQVKAVNEQLEKLNLKIPTIGLVKNKNHQTDRIINNQFQIINIPKNDIAFLFLTNLQDQVHSYAIKYHKVKRSQSMISGILAVIPGIGPKLQKEILNKFPTLESLQNADEAELKSIVKSKIILTKLLNEIKSFDK
jgi:excinuclease ABC subunit C